MGIPLLAGREFTPRDTAGAMKVAIVSERIVRECFPGGPGQALGRRVRVNVLDRGEWLTVVGVVADIRQMSLERDVQPMIYVPFQQDHSGFLRFVAFVARTSTPGSVVEGIRAEIRSAAPDLPIQSTVTMDEAVAASVAQPRFRMVLLVLFAVSATLIATCGLYGLMAYAVTQRRREIGVRMALGATPGSIVSLTLAFALRSTAAGLAIGGIGAFVVTRWLRAQLFQIAPGDPRPIAAAAVLLVFVALIAAAGPARRAARTDPMTTLRAE
jgi:putative ABC transport system permease protein